VVSDPSTLAWVGGQLCRRAEVGVPVDDSAYAEGRGCYTTARIAGGRPLFEDRHVRRLERGVRALALGRLDTQQVTHALRDLGAAAFADGEGIVRVQVSRGPAGTARVVGIPRGLGDEPAVWSAITAPIPHDGPLLAGGHKLTNRLVHALAADAARAAGAREALLFDRAGFLVEGAGSNVVAVAVDGALVTPPLSRGAVAGIARELLVERLRELRERDLRQPDLLEARAVLCTNAVRGARPLSELDGKPLPGADHPWVARLSQLFTPEGEVGG
jgi:branched-chain amino acid aminotransferase